MAYNRILLIMSLIVLAVSLGCNEKSAETIPAQERHVSAGPTASSPTKISPHMVTC